MDCDFSHDPADVPRLIAACEDGADLALGSRYVAGGGTANWGRVRRFVSAGGSFYARILLGVPIRDLTGGFKCYRRRCSSGSTSTRSTRRATPSRSRLTYRALRERLPRRRGADPLRRPHARRLEDEPRDRPRGRLEGAGAAAGRGERDGCDASSTRRRSTRRSRAGRSSSTSGRRGAGRARRSSRSSRSSPVEVARVNIDEEPGLASRYEVLSIPTVILFAGGEAARDRSSGARPRAHFEQWLAEVLPAAESTARRPASARRLSPPRSGRSP